MENTFKYSTFQKVVQLLCFRGFWGNDCISADQRRLLSESESALSFSVSHSVRHAFSSLCYTFRMSNPEADYLYLYYRKRTLVVRFPDVFHTCAVDRLEQ